MPLTGQARSVKRSIRQSVKVGFQPERTKKGNSKPVVVSLTKEIRNIINKWGNRPAKNDSYIFPILNNDLSGDQEFANIKQATKTINKYMKRIAKAVGIKQKVTTYTARHSFSTILKKAGASIEFISESLGHSNLQVTENYLDSFEDNTRRKYASKLTDFKQNHKG